MKNTKERLSRLALEEIFGRENVDTLFEGEDEGDSGATDGASFYEKVRYNYLSLVFTSHSNLLICGR
jgi:hypothetical protein